MLAELIELLRNGRDLSAEQVRTAVAALLDPALEPEGKADFLIALAAKGESVAELTAFVNELRSRSVIPPIDDATRAAEILDVCGTGGDQLNTFNISTSVALVASAAGITVAKHGNRAVTSKCGSADVLEALGIRTDLPPATAARSLREHHFAFFFAQRYHPAFQHIGPIRKLCAQRGQRTLFNFLGPLLNPARPSAQLLGVPRPDWCERLARVLQSSGVRRAMVVSGSAGGDDRYFDELSPLGPTTIAEFYQDRALSVSLLAPEDLGVRPCRLEDLAGGNAQENATLIRRLLSGEDPGPRTDAVLLNTSAALFIAGRTKSLTEGWSLAEELIQSGAVRKQLERLQAFSRDAVSN